MRVERKAKQGRWLTVAGLIGVSAATLLMMAWAVFPAAVAQADPPGNNGTVKIDGVEFDTHPDNEPHVGCIFQVDFYGFDVTSPTGFVTFETQPPTTNPPRTLVSADPVDLDDDDASGGGSVEGFDGTKTYDLGPLFTTDDFYHPQQGYHIKLTVAVPDNQGPDAFNKYKVFWVTGCEVPSPGVDTSITTTLHDANHGVVQNGATVPFGTKMHDLATVVDDELEPVTEGEVQFTFFQSGTCDGDGVAAGKVAVDNNGVAHPSDEFSALAAGSYSFQAMYLGSTNEVTFKRSLSGCEPFTVGAETTTTTTVPTTTTTVPTTTTTVPTTTTTPPSSTTTSSPAIIGPKTVHKSKSETVAPTTVRPGKLAFTGLEDVVPIGALALTLMTTGSGLLWAGARRRRSNDSEDEG